MQNNHEDSQQDTNRIKPAAIKLSHAAKSKTGDRRNKKSSSQVWVWASLAVLIVIAGGVIFVLPSLTGDPEPQQIAGGDRSGGNSAATPSATRPSRPEASPWSEAQLAKLRKETQDILAELLRQQETLEEMNVARWAEDDYTEALAAAEAGDAGYRQREFEQAKKHYQDALDIFQRLYSYSEEYYQDAMDKGRTALRDGESLAARESFQQALLIKPGDADAGKGLDRTGRLDEVFDLIDQADTQLEHDQLDEARQSLQAALAIDAETELAKERLKQVNRRITDRDFNRAMTRGYAALEAGQSGKARDAFRQAGRIKPGSPEVSTALSQANNRLTSEKINQLLTVADNHEQKEEWLSAVHAYDQALALDQSLHTAQQGKERSQWRNNLDKRLDMAIAKPQRLSNQAVNNEARALLHEARSISGPGVKLKRQLAVLGVMLEEAMTPTLVILRSNSETDVTIYKIGKLGRFDRKEIELKPGAYVAVGNREGYRDVRIEFTIVANKTPPPITVQCDEKIAMKR